MSGEVTEVVHVAGLTCTAGSVQRQRCAWCGAVLNEYDLTRTAVAIEPGDDSPPAPPATFEPGSLVAVFGTFPIVSQRAEPELDERGEPKIPARSCMALPADVTR